MMRENVKKTKAQIRKEQVLALLAEADKENQKSDNLHNRESPAGGESFHELYNESLKTRDFKVGDVVKGRVIVVEDDHVLVDINYKSEGVIPKSEFRLVTGQDNIEVGQELDVYIDRLENENGMMVLSKDRADIIRIWKDISKVVENEEIIDGTVIDKVKGGLSVDIGVKAFLPGSQIENRPVRNLGAYIGKKLQFRIIKFNQKRGNIVLSRRVLLSQKRKTQRTRTISNIKEGAVIKGVVKNITDYGAFLDLGGLDGLLHITDMSWSRIKHPSEIISVGEEKEVKVLKYDQDKNRISLGLKQLEDDPWNRINQEIKEGDVVTAHVVTLTDYGAFMKLRDGVEGLVHVSEMSWGKKVKHPSEILKVGQDVKVKVLGIDQSNHRISLGIRQLQKNPWVDLHEKYPVGTQLEASVQSTTEFGVFVRVKGEVMDGFIHVSDLSWIKQVDPRTYKKGDILKVFVKEISVDEERFHLTVKSLDGDPWSQVEKKYPPGSRHEVKVVKLMDFGVFVELEPGVEGLIHVSELNIQRVDKPSDVVQKGAVIKAEVINIDLPARKIGLSIKQIQLREEDTVSSVTHSSSTVKKEKLDSFFGRALRASLGVLSDNKKLEQTDTLDEKEDDKDTTMGGAKTKPHSTEQTLENKVKKVDSSTEDSLTDNKSKTKTLASDSLADKVKKPASSTEDSPTDKDNNSPSTAVESTNIKDSSHE